MSEILRWLGVFFIAIAVAKAVWALALYLKERGNHE